MFIPNMDSMFMNFYLTMKHYERFKEYSHNPVPASPNSEGKAFNSNSADRFSTNEMDEETPEKLRQHRNVDRKQFEGKLEDNDSESSNDSREHNESIENTEDSRINLKYRNIGEKKNKVSEFSVQGHTDFSIDRILSDDSHFKRSRYFNKFENQHNEFDWLSCTRYKPPKIHRLRKKEAPKKRTPGCNPRIPFSEATLKAMETKYQENPYITGDNLKEFASAINISKERIVVWFQNRRARQRREQEAREGINHNAPSRHRTRSSSSSHSDHGSLRVKACTVYEVSPRLDAFVIHPV